MKRDFVMPYFTAGDIELRHAEGEVCIYASPKGLEKLIEFCRSLIDKPQRGHVHLEDYEVLTKDSLKGTIAIFSPHQERTKGA